MLKLGITGGIGSGKSTVAKVFEGLGVPVFYADDEAKKFLFDNNVKDELRKLFGDNIFDSDGEIIRTNLAKIVFSNKESITHLNKLIHPLLMKEFLNWSIQKRHDSCAYVVMEAAILFEAGFNSKVDKVLCVTASEAERIERVVKRDGVEKEQVQARINNQWSDDKRIFNSDYIINNNQGAMILNEIIEIHNELSK